MVRGLTRAAGLAAAWSGWFLFPVAPATAQQIQLVPAIRTVVTSPTISTAKFAIADGNGNLYVADSAAAVVHRIDALGNATIIAGTLDTPGHSGDGGPATSAELSGLSGLALDPYGDLLIADTNNNCVRAVNLSNRTLSVFGVSINAGNINTVVGQCGSTGGFANGGATSGATLHAPTGLAIDNNLNYNLYIADSGNNAIRLVNGNSNNVSTVAGTGSSGYSSSTGTATSSQLNNPYGVALDRAGNLYIADANNNAIRVVNQQSSAITVYGVSIPAGDMATVCGQGLGDPDYTGDNGPASSATLDLPRAVWTDVSGGLYIADTNNQAIRYINGSGVITTIAGNGTPANTGDGGAAASAELETPEGVALDAAGDIFIADGTTGSVREIYTSNLPGVAVGQSTTINVVLSVLETTTFDGFTAYGFAFAPTGGGSCTGTVSAGTTCTATVTFQPGSAGLLTGSLRLEYNNGDSDTNAVPLIGIGYGPQEVAFPGVINTIAGEPSSSGNTGDGEPATSATLSSPQGVAVDDFGHVYIADTGNNRIRTIFVGDIYAYAGTGVSGYTGDNGPAASATLKSPQAVAVGPAGNLYIADTGNNVIREVDLASNVITTVAGNGTGGYNGDGIAATSAELNAPSSVAVDLAGNIYIADQGNYRVREVIAATGNIITVTGTGQNNPNNWCSNPATSSAITPNGVAVDFAGNLYISDQYSGVCRIAPNGAPTIIYNHNNLLFDPMGLATDAAGDVYIADWGNSVVRINGPQVNEIGQIIAGSGAFGFSGDGGMATSAALNEPVSVAVDPSGDVYIVDSHNPVVREVTSGLLAFPLTNDGSSSPALTTTIANIGNETLNISGLGIDSGDLNFTLESGGTCTSSTTLSQSTACTAIAEFTPQGGATQTTTGNLIVTDNSLNTAGNQDKVALTGTAQLPPGAITASGGSPQSTGVNTQFATPLQALVTDVNSIPLVGITVTFTAPTTGQSATLSSSTAVTDSDGHASVTAIANGLAGSYSVTASVNSLSTGFTLTNNPVYALGTSAITVGPAAGGGTVELYVAPSTETWTAQSNVAWLQISAGSASGTGSALIAFTWNANTGASTQIGTLTIAGLTFTVTQAGANVLPINFVSTLVTGITSQGVGVGSQGDVFFTDYSNNHIKKWAASSQTVSTISTPSLIHPWGLGLDSQGNVYFADQGHSDLKEWNASSHITNELTGGLDSPEGIALDFAGDVYIAEGGGVVIDEWVALSDALLSPPPVTGFGDYPQGVAVDAQENVYEVDSYDGLEEWNVATQELVNLAPGSSSTSSEPAGVAVDGAGNAYVADPGLKTITEWNASTQTETNLVTGLSNPQAVAVDAAGNVYFSDIGANTIKKLTIAWVGPGSLSEPATAGSDTLSVVPASTALTGIFAPTSDQSWLTIGTISGGTINFSFTANSSGSSRTAHITVLGQSVTVTQAATSLSIAASHASPIYQGGPGVISLGVTTSGATTHSATVSDTIDSNFTINSAPGCAISGQAVTCTLAAGGTSTTFNVYVTVSTSAPGSISNTAYLTDSGTGDSVTTGSSTDNITVSTQAPQVDSDFVQLVLSGSVDGGGTCAPGSTLTATDELQNTSSSTTVTNPYAEITQLTGGNTLLSQSADSASVVPGATVTFTFHIQLASCNTFDLFFNVYGN
jgi:streptogramin lyase